MNLFYSNEIDNNQITLSEDESKHVHKVMRAGQGETIHVTDGKGKLFKTTLIDSKSRKCLLRIEEVTALPERPAYRLHIAIAPTKNHDRMEWFIEKATEIGISEITPLICDHSERRKIQKDRLERLMVSAIKQSNRFYLPTLNEETPFKIFIEKFHDSSKFIASCLNEEKKLLKQLCQPGKNTLIMIGPEGDFSDEEMISARQHEFIPVSLGSDRYRTETAALMACHTIAILNQ
jgi:16S rRNA (uracil1498-N3)-methyltransferase